LNTRNGFALDIKPALTRQYHAALAMLREAVELCPDELWNGGPHPVPFWQVAYHTLYFTHLYIHPDLDSFKPWSLHRKEHHDLPWPPGSGSIITDPYSRPELLDYWNIVDAAIDPAIAQLDLTAGDCGMPWHRGMPKLDHQLHNLRHIQHHTALLAGRFRAAKGIEVQWVRPKP
jgi:hypothetical protein